MKMNNVMKYVDSASKEEQVNLNGLVRGYGFVREDEVEELKKKQELRANCPIKLTWDEALGKTPISEEKKKALKEWLARLT